MARPGRRCPIPVLPPGSVPRGHDRAGHRHHQGRPDPRPRSSGSASGSRTASSPPSRAALRPRAGPRRSRGAGRPRRPCPRCWASGVRGIGWKDIEVERLPTGQPRDPPPRAGRAAGRAAGDGPDRGLDHPRVGVRGRGRVRGAHGRRQVRVPARHRRRGSTTASASCSPGSSGCATSTSGPGRWRRRSTRTRSGHDGASDRSGFGRRGRVTRATARRGRRRTRARRAPCCSTTTRGAAHPGAREARPQGLVRQAARDRGLARLRGRRAARVPRRRARRAPGS